MRTRRSPRNQGILWRALGGPVEAERQYGPYMPHRPEWVSRRDLLEDWREAIRENARRDARAAIREA